MPVAIAGDPDRLRQLLSNLLFNAVAYNRAHGVVTVDLERASATGELDRDDAAVLRVHDTGIGIDPDDLPRVFDRFYRGERAREREPAGAGLGLALVRWIVDRARRHHRVHERTGQLHRLRGTAAPTRPEPAQLALRRSPRRYDGHPHRDRRVDKRDERSELVPFAFGVRTLNA